MACNYLTEKQTMDELKMSTTGKTPENHIEITLQIGFRFVLILGYFSMHLEGPNKK